MIYQLLMTLMIALFYSCYIFKMLRQRKRGIKTDQMGQGKTGIVRAIEISLKIFAYLEIIASLVSIILDTSRFPDKVRWIGIVFAALGVVAFAKAVTDMKDNWRAGVPETDQTELVTNGIYSFSRNPAFLGFDMLYLGTLITFFNIPFFIVTTVTMLLYHLQIVNVEEDFLLTQFGDAYVEYRKHVCRYFGRRK